MSDRKSRDLPWDRLSTTDSTGKRLYLYLADVRGRFRRGRSAVSAVLIVLFLSLPWVKMNGEQALLLDIPHRRFAILGLKFWAHDAPLLVLVFGGAAVLLGFVTAIWGRVWCGWACPQTVFVDSVFRRIERWTEGDGVRQRALDEAPMSFKKAGVKSLKWSLFLFASMVISHSFLAYFIGIQALATMMESSPAANPVSFFVMAGVTAFLLFDFGWFREQFCTLVCPYGRFQSVLMDDRSLAVVYDSARGEPRRGIVDQGKSGDCVNCFRCVQVCPTGIDIRRGLQMECIACTSCIDACDEVMDRTSKPRGLIRYARGSSSKLSARSWILLGIVLLFSTLLISVVRARQMLEIQIVRSSESPYQEVFSTEGSPELINHFKVEIRNQSFGSARIRIHLAERLGTLVVANHPPVLGPGESERADLFIRFPKSGLRFGHGSVSIDFVSETDSSGSRELREELRLVGPLY